MEDDSVMILNFKARSALNQMVNCQPVPREELQELKQFIDDHLIDRPTGMQPLLLAQAFCRVLTDWLTSTELEQINDKNRTSGDASICATHEYCDPNQAMLDAMATFGEDFKPFDGSQTDVLNEAWSIAKLARFKESQCSLGPFVIVYHDGQQPTNYGTGELMVYRDAHSALQGIADIWRSMQWEVDAVPLLPIARFAAVLGVN